MFESRLLAVLQGLTFTGRSTSRRKAARSARLQVPDALLETMRASPCLRIEASDAARVAFLIGDYDYFLADPASLKEKLDCLRELQSGETLAHWHALIDARDWPALVAELLEKALRPALPPFAGQELRPLRRGAALRSRATSRRPVWKNWRGKYSLHLPEQVRVGAARHDLSPAGRARLSSTRPLLVVAGAAVTNLGVHDGAAVHLPECPPGRAARLAP
jgi:hypothetical protein